MSKKIAVVCVDDVRYVLVNPRIVAAEGEQGGEEGCLSFPEAFFNVRRYRYVKVKALNEKGKPFVIEAKDGSLLARAIQHENDHLNGVLFLDRGDPEFAKQTEAQFKKRAERALEKQKAKAAKAKKIAAKAIAKSDFSFIRSSYKNEVSVSNA